MSKVTWKTVDSGTRAATVNGFDLLVERISGSRLYWLISIRPECGRFADYRPYTLSGMLLADAKASAEAYAASLQPRQILPTVTRWYLGRQLPVIKDSPADEERARVTRNRPAVSAKPETVAMPSAEPETVKRSYPPIKQGCGVAIIPADGKWHEIAPGSFQRDIADGHLTIWLMGGAWHCYFSYATLDHCKLISGRCRTLDEAKADAAAWEAVRGAPRRFQLGTPATPAPAFLAPIIGAEMHT